MKNKFEKTIEILKNLIDLHLIYSDFIWQYEEMHEMIKKMITNYI